MVYDVLIIGAGMAGLMAAIQAGEKGKKVCLVAKGQGATSLTSGTIDLIGSLPGQERVVTDNLSKYLTELSQAELEHPYSIAGLALIHEGIKAFARITEEMGYPYEGNGEANYLLPTAFGTIRPTALVPKTMVQGDVRLPGDVLVIGFKELMDFPARLIADGINEVRGSLGLQGQWRSLRLSLGMDTNNHAFLAKSLQKEAAFNELIKKIKTNISKATTHNASNRIAMPAIMGLDYNLRFYDKMQTALGCPVFEIPFGQPTIPGIRLHNLLSDYAKSKGVEIRLGTEVIAGSLGKQGGEIIVNSPARPITILGKQIVIATGGSFGKGIISNPQEFKESIFNLPLEVSVEEPRQVGIKVNDKFQPKGCEALKVVGRTLAAYDPVQEKSGLGVALVSGYVVGKSLGGGEV